VSDDSTILLSSDHIFWNPIGVDSHGMLTSIAFGNDRFVAVGQSVLASSDGITWAENQLGYGRNGVGFGNGLFVAVGDTSPIETSPDGISWTNFSPTSGSGLYSVAYGNNCFVAAGADTLTSTDGQVWTVESTRSLYKVAFGNNIFVAANGSRVRTSADGINWGPLLVVPTSFTIPGIAFGNGTFVIVGAQGLILSSIDGTNWIQRNAGTTATLSGIAFGKGTFVATSYNGSIFTSNDGATWQQRNTGISIRLLSVIYGNNSFVLVGDNGLILQSDPISDLRIQIQNSQIELDVSCDAGNGCWLQSSTNLISWQNIITTNIQGSLSWFDTAMTNSTQRFYRLVLP